MAAGNLAPLGLAYLIEISFVINLAYHELESFRFRNSMEAKSKEIHQNWQEMWNGNEDIFQPEWDQLRTFYAGKDAAAWENKWIRILYCMFLYSGLDRYIVRYVLALDVAILIVCTAYADATISPIFAYSFSETAPITTNISLWWDSVGADALYWWAAFLLLVLSIILPVSFMYLGRMCKQYVYGCVEEDPLGSEKSGRLKSLEQKVLKKINAVEFLKINTK